MWLAPIDIDPNHGMDDPHSPPRQEYRDMLYRWAEITQGRLVIYDYDQGQLVWRDLPNPSHHGVCAGREALPQSRHPRHRHREPRRDRHDVPEPLLPRPAHVESGHGHRMLSWQEFYPKFYGPAAEPMRGYWSAIYTAWEQTLSTEHEYFVAPAIYTPELVATLESQSGNRRRRPSSRCAPRRIPARRSGFTSSGCGSRTWVSPCSKATWRCSAQ